MKSAGNLKDCSLILMSVHIFITMLYISTKLYTNLVNSQSFQMLQVKLITVDLLQGHVIQYGCQTLFEGSKISM